ncbi:MAG: hypothetical protein QOG71_3606 [Pyrinomonadaceae bacterium]|nr:hypothetical protein [Pyrinomonadaceae bacterium]
MPQKHKYTMRLNLSVLNQLGLNLYSNVPAVLSEVVANAWDAEARVVDIWLDIADDKIVITDDGNGMDLKDINEKFLNVGYQKREVEGPYTPHLRRHVMGRKGIGKLSLFSIANKIEIQSMKARKKNGFLMTTEDVKDQIANNQGVYHPRDIPEKQLKIYKGTRIILTELKKKLTLTETALRKRLARRFSIIGEKNGFQVKVNDTPVTIADRDFFKSIQFLWTIGDDAQDCADECTNLKRQKHFEGIVDQEKDYSISGWIGAVQKHGQLEDGNNKIVILAWGKLVQEDILADYKEGGLYAKYLTGEITANFLDFDHYEDIATSNRQRIIEDDPRYESLKEHLYRRLKDIQGIWSQWRKELATQQAVKNPAIKKWYETLPAASRKHAEQLFDKIETLPMDNEEDRKELYRYGILAFERLQIRTSLDDLDALESVDDLKFASIFNDLADIEAVLYYDIASERVKVIEAFAKIVDKNRQEKVIQKYLYDNLWLLHPSWERATQNPRIEQSVTKEFKKITAALTAEERRARYDIKYVTAAGKHIIIELKKSGRTVKTLELVQQVKKYRDGLIKCLKDHGTKNPVIEVICLLGHDLDDDPEFNRPQLASVNARVIQYNQLIKESLDDYKGYLAAESRVAGLRQLIDAI